MIRAIQLSLLLAVAALPFAARADYLYSMLPAERQPRVLLLVDNSAGIDATALEAIRAELAAFIPRSDGLSLGLARFGKVTDACSHDVEGSLGVTDRPSLLDEVAQMSSGGGFSLGDALIGVEKEVLAVADSDKAVSCRPYHVVLITGPRHTRCASADADEHIVSSLKALRNVSGGKVKNLDVRTFVVRYGSTFTGPGVVSGIEFWDEAARIGGTAASGGELCKPAPGDGCASGAALYANNAADLRGALNRIFSHILYGEYSAIAPVIGTAPQVDTEVGRVARNFMAYTSFRMPGNEGHLYGIRLFRETAPMNGDWKFTNFYDLDLDSCGDSEDNACVFDAGAKLKDKVGRRRIFTAISQAPVTTHESGILAGVTLPLDSTRYVLSTDSEGGSTLAKVWNEYVDLVKGTLSLGVTLPANTANIGDETVAGGVDRGKVLRWLQGDPAMRPWPLGDLYHSASAIIGKAGFGYRTRGYPQFAEAVKRRPYMIYVGANDGMIHAFHAANKLAYQADIAADWEAGEEAWAYLPVSMLARASSAILDGENRFFSQDLSCRVDDVLTYDNMSSGTLDCGSDPYCGWRTVLMCGQGWGGSWYVALDVTDPLDPKPLWESSYDGPRGMGRTWTVPGVALVSNQGMPTWAAVVGNGYNADMECGGSAASCASASHYRLLNLPFDGTFPHHGDGTAGDPGRFFVLDMATGRFLHVQDGSAAPVVADTPVVDTDNDGWTDSAIVGTWQGTIDQLVFAKAEDGSIEYEHCPKVGAFSTGGNKPITSRPAALASPVLDERIHVFAGAGVDGGSYPDEQGSSGNQYDFSMWDIAARGCTTANTKLCSQGTTFNGIFSDGSRLVGSPLFVLRRNGERWLTFTTWLPPSVNQPCAESAATLRCLETSGGTTCKVCGDMDGDGIPDASSDLDTGGRQPTSPTTADGQLYVTTPYGPVRVNNQSGEGGGISGGDPTPNMGAPTSTLILGWREVFD